MYTRQFGKEGEADGELEDPDGIAIDSNDVVYITEYSNDRVSIFTNNGKFIKTFGTRGSEQAQFDWPCGITVDKNGNIYVCDVNNLRLQVF